MQINLPTQKIAATRRTPKTLLIYGIPKVGKTPTMAALENNFLIDLEDRSDHVTGLKMKAFSLRELYEIGEEIKKQGRPYRYVTIDTCTKLEDLCLDHAKEMYLASPIANKEYRINPANLVSVIELPKGAGYFWWRLAYGKWFEYCNSLAETVIFVAHIKDAALSEKNEYGVAANDLSLTGKLKQITCAKADAIGYLYRKVIGAENGKPISQMRINFSSSLDLICGSSYTHLRGVDFDFCPEENPDDWKKIFIEG